MLRQFYFIDQAGKDQGINVRNRAKELAELLSDVDKIRAERKKARQTKSKYIGVEGGGGGGFSMGGASSNRDSGSRFGGFGNESADFGGYNGGGVYGDGGGFSGRSAGGFHDDQYATRSESRGAKKFDEYDEYDDGGATSSRRAAPPPPKMTEQASANPAPPPPRKKETAPEFDLLGGDDGFAPAPSNGKAPASLQAATSSAPADFDDDFDDFQSAAPPKTQSMPSMPPFSTPIPPALRASASGLSIVQPKPVSSNDRSDMKTLTGFALPVSTTTSSFSTPTITPTATGTGGGIGSMAMMSGMTAMQPSNTGFQPAAPNYFTSVPVAANTPGSAPSPSATAQPKKASGDAFGTIWNQASVGIKKSTTPTAKTSSLQTMAKEKATAGIWGTGSAAGSTNSSKPPASSGGNGLEDLLG